MTGDNGPDITRVVDLYCGHGGVGLALDEPTHSTEIANEDGGSKIIYHCRRCGLELWEFDESSPLTDEIEEVLDR